MRTTPWLALALASVLLGACADGESEGGCASSCTWPERCEAGSCTAQCGADADCGHGTLRCATGTCVSRCAGVICPTGQLCEPTTGACGADPDRACGADADCGDGSMRCIDGVCVSKCAGVSCDTAAGEICNPSTGACVGGTTCTTTDDCAGGALCEGGICVAGRFASCVGGQPCAAGLVCVANGAFSICTEPCAEAAECLLTDRCADADDGAFSGHCLPNLCKPGGDTFGFTQDAEYMGPCDAAGEGDGICVGPFPSGDGESGACMGRGLAAAAAQCRGDASHGSPLACSGGFCAGTEDDGVGNCLPWCTLFDGESCPVIAGTVATACYPAWGVNGACLPVAEEPLAQGASCTQPPGALVCAEESLCVPEDGVAGAVSICEALCDPAAASGEPGSCAAGTCTQVVPTQPVFVCAGEET